MVFSEVGTQIDAIDPFCLTAYFPMTDSQESDSRVTFEAESNRVNHFWQICPTDEGIEITWGFTRTDERAEKASGPRD
jgi:hypothetical protein